MTLQKALDITDEMRPNAMSRQLKIVFLTEIEQLVHSEIILKHWHTPEQRTKPEYDVDTDPGTELLIPDPYSMFYPYWIISRIDEQNLEWDKFNNDRAIFENKYDTMNDWYRRNHMPLQPRRHFRA